jgi:hypothetical protein
MDEALMYELGIGEYADMDAADFYDMMSDFEEYDEDEYDDEEDEYDVYFD